MYICTITLLIQIYTYTYKHTHICISDNIRQVRVREEEDPKCVTHETITTIAENPENPGQIKKSNKKKGC